MCTLLINFINILHIAYFLFNFSNNHCIKDMRINQTSLLSQEHAISMPTTWVMACAYSPSGHLVACGWVMEFSWTRIYFMKNKNIWWDHWLQGIFLEQQYRKKSAFVHPWKSAPHSTPIINNNIQLFPEGGWIVVDNYTKTWSVEVYIHQWISKDIPRYGSQSKCTKTAIHWFGKY